MDDLEAYTVPPIVKKAIYGTQNIALLRPGATIQLAAVVVISARFVDVWQSGWDISQNFSVWSNLAEITVAILG